jgi:CubicO group peptidase (beta-lactamase class C family)
MNPVLSSLFVATAIAIAAPAQGMTDARLKELAQQRLQGDRTGACFAVAVVEKEVSRAFVCADPANATRVDARTAFEIGSVSKTMTSALLAEMILAGKASLDEPLAAWLPEGTSVPSFEGQPILLRHLVTHTSGLAALPPGVAITNPADPYAAMDAPALLAALERSQLSAAPGSRFEYSNFASMLLGYAVARRSGVDFETLLDSRLFTPLGMDGAYVNSRPEGIRAAAGHLPTAKPTPAWTFRTELAGVGGVRATLDDMVRYVEAQLGRIEASISPALALAQAPVTSAQPAMAMNWMLAPLNGRTLHAHEGGTGGFSSFVAFDKAAGRGVVILSDTALHSLGGLGSLGLHLLDDTVPLGKPRKSITADPALLDALAGEYQLQGAMTMTLSRKGDHLQVQAQGQPAFEMAHDDAGDFYPLAFDALLTPQRKADGRYGFLWRQGGGAIPAVRIDGAPAAVPELSPEELQAYVGTYPLMPQFAIKVFERDGKLFIQGTGQQALEAPAVAKDVFAVEAVGAEFHFERDASGAVKALTLHQGGQTLRGDRQ